MNYIAYVKQVGYGCDYTIACGQKMIPLSATSMEDAVAEMKKMVEEDFSHDESMLEKCEVFEVSQSSAIDLPELYTSIENAEQEEEARATEQAEREELRKLQEKYGKG